MSVPDLLRALFRRLPPAAQHRCREWLWRRSSGEAELVLVERFADPSGTFVDVGAHRGAYLSRARGRFRRLVGIEPNPELAAYLKRVFPPAEAEILAVGLSEREGTLALHVPEVAGKLVASRASFDSAALGGVPHRTVEVPVRTLDRLGLERVAFLKIDVEGHELAVLRGGTATLSRDRPVLLVEIEERHHPGGSTRVFDFLRQLGYRCHYLEQGRLVPFDDGDLARLQPPEFVKDPFGRRSGRYVDNFLFLPAERTSPVREGP